MAMLAQDCGHRDQHLIAHVMAEAVIDLFEVVDIEHQEKQRCGARCVCQGRAEAVHERPAVGQPGQGVLVGHLTSSPA
nr:hypothetical protein [Pseudomonas sp. StFLB209]